MSDRFYHYYGGPAYTSADVGATWVQRSPCGTFYGAISTSAALPVQLPVFTPAVGAEASPYASFTFQVEDDGGLRMEE